MPAISYPITADTAFIEGPLLYKGGNLKAGAGGASEVFLYDDTQPGVHYLDNFRALVSEHDIHLMDEGIFVMRGIFVDLGANVQFFSLYIDYDVPDATTGPRLGG